MTCGRSSNSVAVDSTIGTAPHYPVAEVGAAGIHVLAEVAECDRGELPARRQIVDIVVDVAHALGRRVVVAEIGIADVPLVRAFALGVGVGAAKVDAEIVELELADELGVDQLPLEPIGILLDERGRQVLVLILHVAIEAGSETPLLQRVPDVEIGPPELMLAELQSKAEQAVHDDPIVGRDPAETRLRRAGNPRIERRLLEAHRACATCCCSRRRRSLPGATRRCRRSCPH
jgi:hypothetical protein